MIKEDIRYESSLKQAIDRMHCREDFPDVSIRNTQLRYDRIMVLNK